MRRLRDKEKGTGSSYTAIPDLPSRAPSSAVPAHAEPAAMALQSDLHVAAPNKPAPAAAAAASSPPPAASVPVSKVTVTKSNSAEKHLQAPAAPPAKAAADGLQPRERSSSGASSGDGVRTHLRGRPCCGARSRRVPPRAPGVLGCR